MFPSSSNDPPTRLISETDWKTFERNKKMLELLKKQVDIFSVLALDDKPRNERLLLLCGILENILNSKECRPKTVNEKLSAPDLIPMRPPQIFKREANSPELVCLSEEDEEGAEQGQAADLRIVNLQSLAIPQSEVSQNGDEMERAQSVKSQSTVSINSNEPQQINKEKKKPGPKIVTFKDGDPIFAKMRGYPPWPAKIVQRLPSPKEKYVVHFYGTHDIADIPRNMLWPVNGKTLELLGKPKRSFGPLTLFNKSMLELLEAIKTTNFNLKEPPVLTPEILTPTPPSSSHKRQAKSHVGPRKDESKKTKVDSISRPGIANGAEIKDNESVSRNGRVHVKPKRFTDGYNDLHYLDDDPKYGAEREPSPEPELNHDKKPSTKFKNVAVVLHDIFPTKMDS